MKKISLYTIIFALTLGVCFSVFCEDTKRDAKIIDLKGAVSVKLGGKDWTPARVGMTVNEGDVVRTATNSWALLNVDGQAQTATVEIVGSSEMSLAELLINKKEKSQKTLLDLGVGKILIKAQKLHSKKSKFEVKTPTSIVGVRGTTFTVEVESLE